MPIISNNINDLAVTVLPDAPVDPVSGLPVPTVAVSTMGGVSVIRHDGTAASHAFTGDVMDNLSIHGAILRYKNGMNFYGWRKVDLSTITGSTFAGPVFNISPLHIMGGKVIATGSATAVGYGGYPSTNNKFVILRENPSAQERSLRADISSAYNTGWQIGDARLTALCDTNPEVITASGNLVVNGTFDVDISGATPINGATLSQDAGRLCVTPVAGNSYGAANVALLNLVVGKTYVLQVDVESTASTSIQVSSQTVVPVGPNNGRRVATFTATAAGTFVGVIANNSVGTPAFFDNISVRLAEPDRSVKNTGLIINGSLTKAPVAPGAQLVGYSGFSASNYLEQPYNSNLDFGTGDFCVMGWFRTSSLARALFDRKSPGEWTTGQQRLQIQVGGDGKFAYYPATGGGAGTTSVNDGVWRFGAVVRSAGVATLYVNDKVDATFADTTTQTNPAAIVRLGSQIHTGVSFTDGADMALWRVSATAPSADQIRHIYETERKLFEPNAKCTIDGSSTAVTAMAYDDTTDLLHVGTSWGRSAFKGLQRVESEASQVGAITSIAASGGTVITAGTSARIYQPALTLREELKRREEAKRVEGRIPVNLDFDATAAQTRFPLPRGFMPVSVYHNRQEQREGATKDFIVEHDGFIYTVVFATGRALNDWVRIKSVRA